MAKSTAESSNALSIFWLKKEGFLCGWKSGLITWTHGFSGNKSSISIEVSLVGNLDQKEGQKKYIDYLVGEKIDCSSPDKYIRLRYTQTDRWTEEKSDMDFKIPITTTPCNYGGKRYWFICPLYKNGQYCGRRVGVIYSIGKWFGCRHCGEIAYSSQMSGGKYRGSSVCIPDIEKAEQEVKRYYYRGKPTRKYRRVMRLNDKLNQWFVLLAARTDKRFARFAGLGK